MLRILILARKFLYYFYSRKFINKTVMKIISKLCLIMSAMPNFKPLWGYSQERFHISKVKVKTKSKRKKTKSLLPRLQFGTSVMCWCELWDYRTVQNDTEQWAETVLSGGPWVLEYQNGMAWITLGDIAVWQNKLFLMFKLDEFSLLLMIDLYLTLCAFHLINMWQCLAQSILQQSQALQYSCFKVAFFFSLSFLSSPLVFLTRFP